MALVDFKVRMRDLGLHIPVADLLRRLEGDGWVMQGHDKYRCYILDKKYPRQEMQTLIDQIEKHHLSLIKSSFSRAGWYEDPREYTFLDHCMICVRGLLLNEMEEGEIEEIASNLDVKPAHVYLALAVLAKSKAFTDGLLAETMELEDVKKWKESFLKQSSSSTAEAETFFENLPPHPAIPFYGGSDGVDLLRKNKASFRIINAVDFSHVADYIKQIEPHPEGPRLCPYVSIAA